MNLRRAVPWILLIALLAAAAAGWQLMPRAAQTDATTGPATSAPAAPQPDTAARPETDGERLRRALLGTWQDEYRGRRTMTLNDDGSGTMIVELSGIQAALFAPELRFEMTWSFDGKILRKKTVSGTPAEKVRLILKTMGDTAEDRLLEVTESQLRLLDQDGTTRYQWTRVREIETEEK